MDSLFKHPDFCLIYVDGNGNISIKRPYQNIFVEMDIRKKNYRCISHYWGIPPKNKYNEDEKKKHEEKYVWKDHGVDGVTWKTEVREEKRERLLQIFKYHKGYFWMDVLCTNQEKDNKPLDIMGDIYRYCIECVCLLDTICNISGFTSERELWIDVAKDMKEYLEKGRNFDEKYGKSSVENSVSTKYKTYFVNLVDGNWPCRVWTWQEATLPPRLLFCSEQAGTYRYDPFDQEFLKKLFPYKFLNLGSVSSNINKEISGYDAVFTSVQSMAFSYGRNLGTWDNTVITAKSRRRCTNREDFVYGIAGVLNVVVPKGLTVDEAKVALEKGLRKQGIFTRHNYEDEFLEPQTLEMFYKPKKFMDGITVLGKIKDIRTLGKFNSDVTLDSKVHGKILYKLPSDGHYEYITETNAIVLWSDRYNIGDIFETTKIGRNGCTFKGHEIIIKTNHETVIDDTCKGDITIEIETFEDGKVSRRAEISRDHEKTNTNTGIFEIKGNVVEVIGYILYE